MLFQYNEGVTPLHRLGPLSKLVMLISFSLLSMAWDTSLRESILLAVFVIAGCLLGRISLQRQLRAMLFLISLSIPYFLLSVLAVREGHMIGHWGPLIVTDKGVDTAGAMTLRMFILFQLSFLYMSTTDPRDLVRALNLHLNIPYRFAFGISISLTFLPLLEEEGRMIAAARRVRGYKPPRSLRERLAWWGGYATAVLVNAVRRVQQTALAMEGKGFGAYRDRTYLRPPHGSPFGVIWSSAIILLTAALWWWS